MQSLSRTPWQRRVAATLSTTLFLILCLAVSCPRFAYAVELSSLVPENQSALVLSGQGLDNGDHGLQFGASRDNGFENQDSQERLSEGQALDNARMVPRDLTALGNNQFMQSNIKIGETQWWYFPKEAVNGNKTRLTPGLLEHVPDRDDNNICTEVINGSDDGLGRFPTVYLSLTTCLKPSLNATNTTNTPDLPQLEVYVSVSKSLQKPGPGNGISTQSSVQAVEGYLCAKVETDGDIYIGVSAPNTTAYTGIYNYQIAASIDGLFHSVVDDDAFLYFVDADVNAALLVTDNLTTEPPESKIYRQLRAMNPPYTIFANNVNDTSIAGLERSYCALDLNAQIRKRGNAVQAGMTTRGLGNEPKEQFYITGLNRSSAYHGILAMDGNSTNSGNGIIGGGGKVYRPMNFTTKAGM